MMSGRVIQGRFIGGGIALRSSAALLRAGAAKPGSARPATVQPRAIGYAQQLPDGMIGRGIGGRPLPDTVRSKMESFFNTDFSDVRIHVGQEAASIGALAFALGSNLYFAPGQLNLDSQHGQALLGHELAHVVQQRAGRVRNPYGSGVAVVQDPALEAEADRLGWQAASHKIAPTVQRKPKAGALWPALPGKVR